MAESPSTPDPTRDRDTQQPAEIKSLPLFGACGCGSGCGCGGVCGKTAGWCARRRLVNGEWGETKSDAGRRVVGIPAARRPAA